MKDLYISLVQAKQFWEDKKANLLHYEELLKNIPKTTDVVLFPEMFHTGFSMNAKKLAEAENGQGLDWLKRMASKYDAAMVASMIVSENNHFYNRLFFVEPDGKYHTYNKKKLFAFAGEHHTFSPGKEKLIVCFRDWNLYLQVCYDLRFPEIARNQVKNEVYDYDVLLNVANWPEKRSMHWKTLLQARAIENQAYVVGVNRIGEGNGLYYSGDSTIVGPAGDIVGQVAHYEHLLNRVLEKNQLQEVREKLPFLKDR